MGLTEKQKRDREIDVLLYLRGYRFNHGHLPNYREIAAYLGCGINAIVGAVNRLVKQGIVIRTSKQARALALRPYAAEIPVLRLERVSHDSEVREVPSVV